MRRSTRRCTRKCWRSGTTPGGTKTLGFCLSTVEIQNDHFTKISSGQYKQRENSLKKNPTVFFKTQERNDRLLRSRRAGGASLRPGAGRCADGGDQAEDRRLPGSEHSRTRQPHHLRCEKTCFLSHFYIQTIILPRQAQDKHRESTQKRRMRFVQASSAGGISWRRCLTTAMQSWPTRL
jgi:hypothetical protein